MITIPDECSEELRSMSFLFGHSYKNRIIAQFSLLTVYYRWILIIFVCYSPTGQLDAYIKNLERVLDAIEFFNQNNPSCVELSNLVCVTFYFIY